MSCVLRVYGEGLEIDALLARLKLVPVRTWKKGQERPLKGRFHVDSGANFVVSDAEIDDFPAQLADAESYLASNHEEIWKLTTATGVAQAVLDFAVATRPGFVTQTSNFSMAFLQRMIYLKLDLAVSHYPTETDIGE
jgi:hypothetical protein